MPCGRTVAELCPREDESVNHRVICLLANWNVLNAELCPREEENVNHSVRSLVGKVECLACERFAKAEHAGREPGWASAGRQGP